MTKRSDLPEIGFEQAIVDIAWQFGWRVASFRSAGGRKDGGHRTPVKYNGKGYPDLTLVHESGIVIFAEIKAERGTMSADQKVWAATLTSVETAAESLDGPSPIRYRLWKPRDSDAIITELSHGRTTTWVVGPR